MTKSEAADELQGLYTQNNVTQTEDYRLVKKEPGDTPTQIWEVYRKSDNRTVVHRGMPLVFRASNQEDADEKLVAICAQADLGAPQIFAARKVGYQQTQARAEPYEIYNVVGGNTMDSFQAMNDQEAIDHLNHWINSDVHGHLRDDARRLFGVRKSGGQIVQAPGQVDQGDSARQQQATDADGLPMYEIHTVRDNQVVHRFASSPDRAGRTALQWLRDNGHENPALNYRIRPMYGSHQPAPVAGSTQDIQQQRAQTGFTGSWKILDSTGRELHRFSGVGNNQREANRVAHEWLMDQGSDVPRTGPVEVVPVMGDE
jgi:hypothetical protein